MQSILVQLFSFQLKLLLSRPPAHLFIIITMFLSMYKFNAVWRSVERATFIRFCFNRTPRLFASFCHFHDIGNINNDQSSHLHSSFFTPSHIEILFNYVKIMGNVVYRVNYFVGHFNCPDLCKQTEFNVQLSGNAICIDLSVKLFKIHATCVHFVK